MNGTEKIVFGADAIEFDGGSNELYIMHRAELSVMKELADLACKNGGDILEIGFGMGLSAQYVQSHKIKSHTIIEVHSEIYERALDWSEWRPNVTVILGDWYDILPVLNKKFDGILHDTHQDEHLHKFFEVVPSVCKNGTRLAMFSYPFENVPLNKVDVFLNEYERTIMPIKHIRKFTLNWNTYIDGRFVL